LTVGVNYVAVNEVWELPWWWVSKDSKQSCHGIFQFIIYNTVWIFSFV